MNTVTEYALRCLRTFVAAFLVALPVLTVAGTADGTLKSAALSAAIAGANAVLLLLQKLIPVVPDP